MSIDSLPRSLTQYLPSIISGGSARHQDSELHPWSRAVRSRIRSSFAYVTPSTGVFHLITLACALRYGAYQQQTQFLPLATEPLVDVVWAIHTNL